MGATKEQRTETFWKSESLRIFAQLANIWGKEFLVTCLFKKEKASLYLFSTLGCWIQHSRLAAGAVSPESPLQAGVRVPQAARCQGLPSPWQKWNKEPQEQPKPRAEASSVSPLCERHSCPAGGVQLWAVKVLLSPGHPVPGNPLRPANHEQPSELPKGPWQMLAHNETLHRKSVVCK